MMTEFDKNESDLAGRHHLVHDVRNHLMSTSLLVSEAVRKHSEGVLVDEDLAEIEEEVTQLSSSIQKLLDQLDRE